MIQHKVKGTDIIIREGRLKDRESVVQLWTELTDLHVEISTIEMNMVENSEKIIREFYERSVRSRKRMILVAENDEHICGYLLGSIQKRPPTSKETHMAHITDVYLRDELRRKGIGREMIMVFRKWVESKGITLITLDVVPENEQALEFYKSLGFKTVLLHQHLHF